MIRCVPNPVFSGFSNVLACLIRADFVTVSTPSYLLHGYFREAQIRLKMLYGTSRKKKRICFGAVHTGVVCFGWRNLPSRCGGCAPQSRGARSQRRSRVSVGPGAVRSRG